MELYAGIDLHSNNHVLAVLDSRGRVVLDRRLSNQLEVVAAALEPIREQLCGVVVESTFNWYWLVDGLMDLGYRVHLANTTAIEQYSGLKYADDRSDARWLAEMLRIGVLPEGYIYPKQDRPVRDLLRKRGQLVRHRTMHVLSIQNLIHRNTGRRVSSSEIQRKDPAWVADLLPDPMLAQAVEASLAVVRGIEIQRKRLERAVLERVRPNPLYGLLQTIHGIGKVLALTILLETGDIGRFASAGQYASYSRMVDSKRLSNGKKKGKGNRRNGNRYLAWAYAEAAVFAIRYQPVVNRYYQRKRAKTNRNVALKTVSHKLARAAFWVMSKGEPFDLDRAFA